MNTKHPDDFTDWTLDDILASTTLEKAREEKVRGDTLLLRDKSVPFKGENPPLGTWRYDEQCGFEVLVEVDPHEVDHSHEYDGWPLPSSVYTYTHWFEEGYVPPPIVVLRHKRGHLVSINTRRVLAARRAGIDKIPAWFSETTDDGSIKWNIQ